MQMAAAREQICAAAALNVGIEPIAALLFLATEVRMHRVSAQQRTPLNGAAIKHGSHPARLHEQADAELHNEPDCKESTRVERESEAESLLTSCAFGAPQLLCDFTSRCFLARHRLQIADFAGTPSAPLSCFLSHETSLSTKAACIPYGRE
jgi:hypothetical protein